MVCNYRRYAGSHVYIIILYYTVSVDNGSDYHWCEVNNSTQYICLADQDNDCISNEQV